MTATRFSADACCSGVTPGDAAEVDRLRRVVRLGLDDRALRRVVVVRLALVDALILGHGGLAGTDALERGEQAARVRRDPHVHHRVLAAGVDAAGAVAGGVGDARRPGLAVDELPAQVVVDVPLHQRPGPVDERRIVGRARRWR